MYVRMTIFEDRARTKSYANKLHESTKTLGDQIKELEDESEEEKEGKK